MALDRTRVRRENWGMKKWTKPVEIALWGCGVLTAIGAVVPSWGPWTPVGICLAGVLAIRLGKIKAWWPPQFVWKWQQKWRDRRMSRWRLRRVFERYSHSAEIAYKLMMRVSTYEARVIHDRYFAEPENRRTNDGLVCRGMAAVCLKSGRDEHADQWRERAKEIEDCVVPLSRKAIPLHERRDSQRKVLTDGIPSWIDHAN